MFWPKRSLLTLVRAMASTQRNDIDVMIDILEEAALRSIDAESHRDKQRSPQELRLIMDLIEEKMVRGENLSDHNDPLIPRGAALRGINLKGRRYLQELKDYKRDRGWRGTLDKAGWVIFGFLLALLSALISATSRFVGISAD